MFEIFEAFIASEASFTPEELMLVRSLATEKKLRRKQLLLREGEVCRHKAFVCKGLLRTYRTKEDGTESIMRFATENSWSTEPQSYNKQMPSQYNIEALEDTKVILWSRESMEELFIAVPSFRLYSEKLKEHSLDASQNRILMNISYTTEEKYQAFITSFPDIFRRVPLHMYKMHEHLLHIISAKVKLTENDISLCREYFEPVLFPKNRVIEEEGKIPKYLYYTVSGFIRLFHYNDMGDEITTHINCPPGFITSYFNFINHTRSEENVECITDCELLRISKNNLDLLTNGSAAFKDFSIYVFQQAVAYNENRSKELATLTAEQRYKKLIENYPGILHNVPVQYIASFLGMKPESLSRIRKKIIT
ncbi:cyclic nucleotide-binding-like protein [Russula earlei]|uniref:Cyclic nucleotide-binding-like protein n=1 Tax=Russula earlei TaxID=71964 RepID=A0ACC0TS44_9AGAM|nr:cyclic nucleotide-binding-like protein [Russula earlei]